MKICHRQHEAAGTAGVGRFSLALGAIRLVYHHAGTRTLVRSSWTVYYVTIFVVLIDIRLLASTKRGKRLVSVSRAFATPRAC